MEDKKVVLIIRDGWGNAPANCLDAPIETNAIHLAQTPIADTLWKNYPTAMIKTSGESVGLPEGIMGNSEVGHQNIGAGRVVPQELKRLSELAQSSEFKTNSVIQRFYNRAQEGRTAHIIGLVSSGRIHSDISHLFALIDAAPKNGKVCIHAITDGRDCSPTSGLKFISQLEEKIKGTNVRIASVMGRYWAMDRDLRWERVAMAYEALTGRQATHKLRGPSLAVKEATSALDVINKYYKEPNSSVQLGDEFITPTRIIDKKGKPIGTIEDGDSVFFFNYRGDRPRELTRAFVLNDTEWSRMPREAFTRGNAWQNLYFATMTNYEKELPVSDIAFDRPEPMKQILGEVLEQHGLSQLRCAETEKFPHVTFFFNDYRETPFNGERRLLFDSPTDVETYDQKPEMSAYKICDGILEELKKPLTPDVLIINFANGDMVGHTGNLKATVKAIEVVDECCGKIIKKATERDYSIIITADHGNAECTWDVKAKMPHTAHTTYDVPLHLVSENKEKLLKNRGVLADIAPTILELIGVPKPKKMTGQSLISK